MSENTTDDDLDFLDAFADELEPIGAVTTVLPAPITPAHGVPALERAPRKGELIYHKLDVEPPQLFTMYQEVFFGGQKAYEGERISGGERVTIYAQHCMVMVPDEDPDEDVEDENQEMGDD